VRWIRSPAWDLCWIWSGIPAGIVLTAITWFCWRPLVGFQGSVVEQPLYWFFALVVMLETGHVISPIVLVWSHPQLRLLAWQRRKKFVWLSLAAFGTALLVGAVTSLGWTSFKPGFHQQLHITTWTNPFPVLVWIYLVLNAYHFGMQNFGVTRIYKRLNGFKGHRWLDMTLAVGITAVMAMLLPDLIGTPILGFLLLGLLSLNHWLVEIGLCGRASGNQWLFIGVVLALGTIGFAWLRVTPSGNMMVVIPVVVGARLGLSFVHFLYDRWIWKFSDPEIRATIGRKLFARA
jgi:hypothetical protein